MHDRFRILALVAGLLMAAAEPICAAELATCESALAAVFPGAAVERRSVALSETEMAHAKELAGEAPASRLAIWHEATRDAVVIGRGWLDTHLVRTLPETILVSVDAQGRVLRIDVLTFREPREYLPPVKWLAQFDGKPLSNSLAVKRDIAALGGATLSGRAITKAVRCCLALDSLVRARATLPSKAP